MRRRATSRGSRPSRWSTPAAGTRLSPTPRRQNQRGDGPNRPPRCRLRTPNADAAFYLDYAARPSLLADAPQTVTVSAGDQVLQSFLADAAGRRLRRVSLPAEVLGSGDTAEIRIAVDRTFVPPTQPAGGGNERELGIQVHHAFVVLR